MPENFDEPRQGGDLSILKGKHDIAKIQQRDVRVRPCLPFGGGTLRKVAQTKKSPIREEIGRQKHIKGVYLVFGKIALDEMAIGSGAVCVQVNDTLPIIPTE